ncbi:MAG TPA: cation:proton antiporter [Blastocatellia bacterium]|nr:cation:proton antiporter [Blastocatellia bacterium]
MGLPTILNQLTAAANGGSEHGKILLSLFIVLAAGKLMAELSERLRQPAVVGEILAGVIIGPSVLSWVQPTEVISTLAEIGVIFLLFTVGLETRPSELFRVGGTATLVAILGVIVPFLAGWGLLSIWPRHSWIEAVFLGAAMVATSVGITARVLASLGILNTDTARVILAAAVIDDVIGLLVLAVVSSLATGHVNYGHLAVVAVLAIVFTILTSTLGSRVIRRVARPVEELRINHSLLIFGLLLCFGFAAIASLIGIAGIVGAFLAGVALSEATEGTTLHHQSEALMEFAAPFFLVNIGLRFNPAVFGSAETIWLASIVTVLAILTKVIGCGIGASRLGLRSAIRVGVGMSPRGEVGIVVAQIGLSLAAVSDAVYGVVLAMALATTILAPPLIRLANQGEAPTLAEPAYEDELRGDIG